MSFRVGQKVVRVKGQRGDAMFSGLARSDYSYPEYGEVCTVATINHWPRGAIITLREHDNSHLMARYCATYEPGFAAKCFRPVVKRKTDISIFTKMLDDARSKEPA